MYKVNSKMQTIVKRLPLMAAILGAGLAMAQNSHVQDNQPIRIGNTDYAWFTYDGTGSEIATTNYNAGQDTECTTGNNTCSILVEVADGQPVLDMSDVDSNGHIITGSHVSQVTRKN